MGRPKNNKPSYLEHKQSGQARVRINGRDVYLGPYGSPESWQKYHQLMLDHAAGRPVAEKKKVASDRLAIGELVEFYKDYAAKHYGPKAKELSRIKNATRPLQDVFGDCPVDEFGPLKLQAVLEQLVANGDTRKAVVNAQGFRPLSRTTVNDYLQVIKRMFRVGVSQEWVPAAIFTALDTVEGLRKGKGELSKKTKDKRKVKPAPVDDIQKTIDELSPELATMVQVQVLTGMRPDEVTIMRPGDIDRSQKKCWSYQPGKHKNDWREGMEVKEVLIGPRAQKLLLPFLKDCADDDYLFSPRRVAERWNEEQIRETGKEPAFVKLNALKPPRDHYDDHSYAQAVRRACKRAGVDVWTPGQLRHNAGTFIRSKYGAEASKLCLGHKHLSTTEIYAEKDRAKYAQIMSKVG